jgi:hypothetical protein
MKRTGAFLLAVAAASISQDPSSCHAQDYGSYEESQDNLYANYYAAKQQEKAAGG